MCPEGLDPGGAKADVSLYSRTARERAMKPFFVQIKTELGKSKGVDP